MKRHALRRKRNQFDTNRSIVRLGEEKSFQLLKKMGREVRSHVFREIDLVDEIIVQNLRDEQQTLDIDALAVEYAIDIGPSAMYLTGKLCIAHVPLLHLFLDETSDVDVSEVLVLHVSYLTNIYKKRGRSPTHLLSGIAKHHCQNE